MERTHFEVYEQLKKDNYETSFCEAYKDCYFLSRLEGKVFYGKWSGYALSPNNDDKTYFTIEGIRGSCEGIFTVINGKLHQLEQYNEFKLKDKYKEFAYDLYKYFSLKEQALEQLQSLPEVTSEAKVQIQDHINTLNTLNQMLAKY